MPPLSEQVDRLQWYQTIALPDGISTSAMLGEGALKEKRSPLWP